ncbi:MAG: hypothetical protein KDE62_10745, partial [Calditrichaeota bacterium]|nr:hypothetical protein [Calditrichota bacterium]
MKNLTTGIRIINKPYNHYHNHLEGIMKYQIALLAAALFMLVFSSCEKGTLDPSTGTGSTSAASYDGALNRN